MPKNPASSTKEVALTVLEPRRKRASSSGDDEENADGFNAALAGSASDSDSSHASVDTAAFERGALTY